MVITLLPAPSQKTEATETGSAEEAGWASLDVAAVRDEVFAAQVTLAEITLKQKRNPSPELNRERGRRDRQLRELRAKLRLAEGKPRELPPGSLDSFIACHKTAFRLEGCLRQAEGDGEVFLAIEYRHQLKRVPSFHREQARIALQSPDNGEMYGFALSMIRPKSFPREAYRKNCGSRVVRGRAPRRSPSSRTRGSRRSATGSSSSSTDPGDEGSSDPPGPRALAGGDTKSQRLCPACERDLDLLGKAKQAKYCCDACSKWVRADRHEPGELRPVVPAEVIAREKRDFDSASIESLRAERYAEWKYGGDKAKRSRIEERLQEMYGAARRAAGSGSLPADFLTLDQKRLVLEMETDGHGQPLYASNTRARVFG